MADLKEDWIDFGRLEQELDQAVEKDARYWRENDAKFRAVGQRVETYEQFRDIVKAAHIKPLEKKDKIGQGKRNQPWNPYTSKSFGPETSKAEHVASQELKKLPRTSHEFTRDWRTRCRTDSERYQLLTSLGAEQLFKIFRAEIGFGLLGDIVGVLEGQLRGGDERRVVGILESLARANRFGLAVQFLSQKERERCAELFRKLERETQESQDDGEGSSDLKTTEGHTSSTSDLKVEQPSDTEENDTGLSDKFILLRKDYKV